MREKLRGMQQTLGCPLVVQSWEAYGTGMLVVGFEKVIKVEKIGVMSVRMDKEMERRGIGDMNGRQRRIEGI